MNRLLFFLAAAAVAVLAHAQAPSDSTAAQRARISAERSQVEATFRAQEKTCYGKFAVNDCLGAARAVRREALADLHRQEVSLNDAERKRKGAERQREIEERSAPAAHPPGQAAKGNKPGPDERDAQASRRAAERASREASLGARPDPAAQAQARKARQQAEQKRRQQDRSRASEEAAQAVKHREEQRNEAQQRREAVNRRLAERNKPPASPLPVPQ
jgi:hypothetical protein